MATDRTGIVRTLPLVALRPPMCATPQPPRASLFAVIQLKLLVDSLFLGRTHPSKPDRHKEDTKRRLWRRGNERALSRAALTAS